MSEYQYEYKLPLPLKGSPQRAFRALVDGGDLRAWFAEDVDVDAREGGRFHFWGKHTYGCPARSEASQSIIRLEADRLLEFSWRLLERDTRVEWEVSEEESEGEVTTRFTVRHTFDALPDLPRAREWIDDLWRVYTGSLCFYLMGDQSVYRPDFADPSPVVRNTIEIDAPPERVFRTLTEPELIKKWFPAPAPVVEPRVGGDYGFGFSFEKDGATVTPPPMKILAFEENRKLTITWPDWRMDPSVPDQKVTWLLEDLGGRTRLTLVHDGFVRTVDVSDFPFGWQEFLEQIRSVSVNDPA